MVYLQFFIGLRANLFQKNNNKLSTASWSTTARKMNTRFIADKANDIDIARYIIYVVSTFPCNSQHTTHLKVYKTKVSDLNKDAGNFM
jgi:hypothetical protein